MRRLNRIAGYGRQGKGELGMTLVETLIAVAILSVIAGAFLNAMVTSTRATTTLEQRTTAESLARSQMEYIKQQEYRADLDYTKLPPEQIPAGFDIQITAERLNPRGDSPSNDDGLQKITITVTYHSKPVITLEGYKCFSRY